MIALVLNSAAGSVQKLGADALVERLTTAIAAATGTEPQVVAEGPDTLSASVDRLVDGLSPGDEVWVAGGDGTVTAIARRLLGREVVLGVVPLGTMNLLARDLGVPMEVEPAVDALAAAPVRPIDVARMNGEAFLVKSALGLYPEMVVDRERRRRVGGLGKWPAMLRAMWRTLRRNRRMTVRLALADGTAREVRTSAVVVANNALQFHPGRIFTRPVLDAGDLVVYVSHRKSRLGAFGQTLEVFLGALADDPEMEVIRTPAVTLDFRHSRPIANDGEVESARAPLHYEIERKALPVRYPGADA
ncbi:MAG: sphingosine kinase [Alphaproteobacteria bacterium]|jgi:diacylglycerol kinase family enzyme|nr:sphingosine kinase [Alphaproteobacteria bacterium]